MNQHDDSDLLQQSILPLSRRWQAVLGRQAMTRLQPITAGATSLPAAGSLQHARALRQAPVLRALRQAGQEGDGGKAHDVDSYPPAGSRNATPGQTHVQAAPGNADHEAGAEQDVAPSSGTVLRTHRRSPIATLPARMQTQPYLARAVRQMDAEPRSAASPAGDSPQVARRQFLAAVQTMQSMHQPGQQEATAASLEDTDRAGVLDTRIQGLLAGMLNLRLPAVRVQADAQADAVARSLAADAVAYRDRILFRAGKFAPHTAAGLALVGHELTHVAAAHGQPIAQPGASRDSDSEEAAALHNEARVLRHFASAPARYPVSPAIALSANPNPGSRVTADTGSQPTPGPAMAPKTALSARTLPGDGAPPRAAATDLSAQQLKLIKDEVYRDLLDRIRTDFERGA